MSPSDCDGSYTYATATAAGCKQITGDLHIGPTAATSLAGLDGLTFVGGSLVVASNDNLASLSGLSSLARVDGSVDVMFNLALTNLTGLEGLGHVGGELRIRANGALTSLHGLNQLNTVHRIVVADNPSFTELDEARALCSAFEPGGSGAEHAITIGTANTRTSLAWCQLSALPSLNVTAGSTAQLTTGVYEYDVVTIAGTVFVKGKVEIRARTVYVTASGVIDGGNRPPQEQRQQQQQPR